MPSGLRVCNRSAFLSAHWRAGGQIEKCPFATKLTSLVSGSVRGEPIRRLYQGLGSRRGCLGNSFVGLFKRALFVAGGAFLGVCAALAIMISLFPDTSIDDGWMYCWIGLVAGGVATGWVTMRKKKSE